jgi:hypothetical protein
MTARELKPDCDAGSPLRADDELLRLQNVAALGDQQHRCASRPALLNTVTPSASIRSRSADKRARPTTARGAAGRSRERARGADAVARQLTRVANQPGAAWPGRGGHAAEPRRCSHRSGPSPRRALLRRRLVPLRSRGRRSYSIAPHE